MKTKTPIVAIAAVMIVSSLQSIAGQGPQPGICNRGCWGARAPKCGITQMSSLNRAIIHHTANASDYNTSGVEASKAIVRNVQNIHMDANGWCDIGYHFLVDKYGNIFEGRSGAMSSLPKGSHDGNNVNSFGFNLLGYFHGPYNNDPNATMRGALYDVIAWRMPSTWSPYGSGSYNSTTVGNLDGHRKVKATACPGDLVHPTYITENYSGGEARNGVNARKNGTGGTANPPYYFDTSAQGWTPGNGTLGIAWEGCCGWPGVMYTDQVGNDAFIHSPATSYTGGGDVSFNVQVYPQGGTTASHQMQLFWKTAAENFWDGTKASPKISYNKQNGWHSLNLSCNSTKYLGQNINQLRLDFDDINSSTRWIVNHVLPQTVPRYYFDSGTQGWTAGNGMCCGVGWSNSGWPGVIYADQNAPDGFFLSPTFSFLGAANDVVRVRLYPQNGITANHDAKIYFKTSADAGFTEAKSTPIINYTAQGVYYNLTFNVGSIPGWSGAFINQLRFDVDSANTGTRWIIDYIMIDHQ